MTAKRDKFLPHGGTYFDDMKVGDLALARQARKAARQPQEIDEDIMPFFLDIKERPHARIFVQTPKVAAGVNQLVTKWYEDGFLSYKPSISLDPTLKLIEIKVEDA